MLQQESLFHQLEALQLNPPSGITVGQMYLIDLLIESYQEKGEWNIVNVEYVNDLLSASTRALRYGS